MSTCRATRGGKRLGAGRPRSKPAPTTALKKRVWQSDWQAFGLADRREPPRLATRALPGQVRAGKMRSTATAAEQQSGTHPFEGRAYGADLTAKGEPLKRRPSAHSCTYLAAAAPRPSRHATDDLWDPAPAGVHPTRR
jgi:hypothetical protein